MKKIGIVLGLVAVLFGAWYVFGPGAITPQQGADTTGVDVAALRAPEGATDEEALEFRARKRWDAMIELDLDTTYEFATPTYRANYNLAHYRRQYAAQVKRTGYEVYSVDIDEADPRKAKVVILLNYETAGYEPGQVIELRSRHVNTWVKRNGEWWFVEPR